MGVQFSDKVDIREMSVDKLTHSQEVKNPQGILQIVGKTPKSANVQEITHNDKNLSYHYVVYILIGIGLAVAILFFRSRR